MTLHVPLVHSVRPVSDLHGTLTHRHPATVHEKLVSHSLTSCLVVLIVRLSTVSHCAHSLAGIDSVRGAILLKSLLLLN